MSRGDLHERHREDLIAFARGRGYVEEPTKGDYEVLRLRRPGKPPAIFFRRARSTPHYTVPYGEAANLVSAFFRDRRRRS